MSNETGQSDGVDAAAFEVFRSLAKSQGPEVAFRQLARIFGEDSARKTQHAYERAVGIISQAAGPATLRKKGIIGWYAGPSEDDRFWPALRKYLLEAKRWPRETVDSVDAESTSVMKLLPHAGGQIDVKGLVVGYVQSGKTANYTALIAKAADVGYRLIIVLAGVHNSLRRQTQERLENELINADPKVKSHWHTLTYAHEDFRARGTNTDAFLADDSHQRILLVVKKNARVLERLIAWVQDAQPKLLEACPALIIDDEADQAGLNTAKADANQRSVINRLVLELKRSLPKSAYVGYTATPFANVLVDPSGKDLYPADFIVALEKPVGYFGAELFSGREPLDDEGSELPPPPDVFRQVTDDEVSSVRPIGRAAIDSFQPAMVESLSTAIRYFLLATAARWARGQRRRHSSMLVHTSLNLVVHQRLQEIINEEVDSLRESIRDASTKTELERLWNDEHPRVQKEGLNALSFAEVERHLEDVLARTRVVVDNGISESRLIYKDERDLSDSDPIAHIAVGGNTLSRGLTLEGLVVSYFVRTATAYDTLLQMGRWFGYRFGYEDLPRLWMTSELQAAFKDLATVEEEVRRDIGRYEKEGLTPLEFAPRIRTHPTLAITSRLKMQYAIPAGIDYSGFTRQTTIFYHRNRAWLLGNWAAGVRLFDDVLARKGAPETKGSHTFFKGVEVDRILAFLDQYECHEHHTELRRELLKKYIEKQNAQQRCQSWTVALVSLRAASATSIPFGKNLSVVPVVRSKLQPRGDDGVDLGTITTQANFGFDLPTMPEGDPTPKEQKRKNQPKRPVDAEPLLLLYPIQKDSQAKGAAKNPRTALDAVEHILGLALAFPDSPSGKRFDYVQVNLPPREMYIEEDDITLDEEDDG